ncbi:hypothetical protein DMN91_002008 [Ooceraea biroi]|uniref:Major facilitator superfamily (MFS) profile domain-containing protein n=1 Tax=Ooceraea biroi TaxID=2015173 RepID=A0A3L8DZL3_OOCBI|nr:hypothetical protein DMN91_002008 [Ooceraea biroi]
MSAWGDIQSFGSKRLQDGESAPIGSNRGGAQIRAGGRVALHDLWIPWDVRLRNCLVYRDSVLENLDGLANRSSVIGNALAYKTTLAQNIFFIGAICGGFLFGWLSDKYGRIPVLIGTNIMGFIGGFSTVYVTFFWQFYLCRFIVGFAFDNMFAVVYILVLEYVGSKWQTFADNMSYGIFYSAAAMWLISKGKIEKAVKIIMKIEKINFTSVPQDIYENFLDDCVETAETLATKNYSTLQYSQFSSRLRDYNKFPASYVYSSPETVKEQLPQSLMRFWETPSTRKKEPMAPMNHHLRAKRSVSRRGAVLRSSMVSGHLGNVRRYEAVMAGMEQLDDRLRGSALGTATPMEYVDLFRKSYKEKQKQESNVNDGNVTGQGTSKDPEDGR